MIRIGSTKALPAIAAVLGLSLVILLCLPIAALAASSGDADWAAALSDPLFAQAMWLSLRTSLTSLAIIVMLGTPLAWWLARSHGAAARIVSILVELPIVIPPAVMGVALLQAFGRNGLLGPFLSAWDVSLPFSTTAVIVAQVAVSAPFFVQAAASGFREIDDGALVVARTLGASPAEAFGKVGLPMALPGLITGASLAWARALGEFGATLIFAGNMTGTTQTMPLAIYAAMESDVQLAIVLSVVLTAVGALMLIALRALPSRLRGHRG